MGLCQCFVWLPFLTAVLQGRDIELFEWHKSCGTKTLYADFCGRKSHSDCASVKSSWWTELKRFCAQICLLFIICCFRSCLPLGFWYWNKGGAAKDQDTMIYAFPFGLELLSSKFVLQRKPVCLIFGRSSPGFMNLKPLWGCPAWRRVLLFCYYRFSSRQKNFLI